MTPFLTCLTIGAVFIFMSSMAMAWALNHDRLDGADFILKRFTVPSAAVLFVIVIVKLFNPWDQ